MTKGLDEFQLVSGRALDDMARDAARNERKRVHLLLHDGHGDQVQRLIIVTQPEIPSNGRCWYCCRATAVEV